jgi:hypothetical protein
MALLVATAFVSVALIILGALFVRLMSQKRQVDQFAVFGNCLHGVESGIAASWTELVDGEDGWVGLDEWSLPEGATEVVLPSFEDDGVTPLTLASMDDVEYFALAFNWLTDGFDNNGDGTIDGTDEIGFYSIYSFGRHGDLERGVEVVLEGHNISPWDNAVFAGSGAAGGAIQGNCSMHGSVHILGDSVPEGGEAIVVIDLMGASLIHNNYGTGAGPGPALPDYLRDRVPALPRTTLPDGEDVETLRAKFRVKHGLCSLNSASEIGEPDDPGSGMKTRMDGIYNTDGWTGSRVTPDGGKGDPSVVYSDNGWDDDYDLGDAVSMPMLSDDWRWPERVECYELGYEFEGEAGATEESPDGDNYRHDEYFPELMDGPAHEGDVTISVGTDFYLNLSRPADTDPTNRVQPDPENCVKGDDYLYYDASTNVLEINGQVEINGDLEIASGSGKKGSLLYYTGRAALLVHGDVTVAASMLTCNDGDPNDYVESFPEKNCLGIMAEYNMYTGVGAQRDLMGAFYAQGTIESDKQTVLMGTFVSNFINMGQQVPDVYQVPELVNNLPLGMVANYPMYAYSQVSWREL